MDISYIGKFSKMEVKFEDKDFKQEWSNIEIKGVKSILTEIIKEEDDFTSAVDANQFFSLAYTSHARFAELNVCDPNMQIEGNTLNAFIIRNNNQLIAFCFDENDDEVYYEVLY